jgi:alpha-tubulin suppressor-like RCC1 family protein
MDPETFTTLASWGGNYFGQLGNGIPLPHGRGSNTPVEVSGLDGAGLKAISAGGGYSLALTEDGTVWAWGLNQYGQLGDGTNTDSSTPVQVKDPDDPTGYLTGINAITTGSWHSLALKDEGTILAWGSNQIGQLGDGTNTDSNTPVEVGSLDGAEAIAAGNFHSLTLKNDGTVWAWGSNTTGQAHWISGQLGDDEITSSSTPVEVSGLPGGVKAIAAGSDHSLALKEDGSILAWGSNTSGQLGNGTNTSSSTPVQVNELDGVTAIDGGGDYSLALKDAGTVWAWGSNQFGQLGDGITTDGTPTICENTGVGATVLSSCTDSNTPVQMREVGGITAIAAGGAHGLALKNDGTVWAWGFNQSGQLGNGTNTLGTNVMGINTPVQVSELSGVKAIAAGSDHSLAGR